MAYASGSPEGRAIGTAGMKAGLIGSGLIAIGFSAVIVLGQEFLTLEAIWSLLGIAALAFIIAFFVGTIGVMLCLILLGFPLARLLRDELEDLSGLVGFLGVATVASAAIAMVLLDASLIPVVLAYALPAAFYYRREILLEQTIS